MATMSQAACSEIMDDNTYFRGHGTTKYWQKSVKSDLKFSVDVCGYRMTATLLLSVSSGLGIRILFFLFVVFVTASHHTGRKELKPGLCIIDQKIKQLELVCFLCAAAER